MQEGELTADIVRTYQNKWNKGKTFVFGVDRAHAQQLQKRFIEAGVKAGYQDSYTKINERKKLKEQFHNGEIDVLTNVGTLTTGVDYDVRCLILARPTKSDSLFQQIIGRALRIAEGKEYAMILDHSDTTSRLGFITDVEARYPVLSMGDKKTKSRSSPEKLPKECIKCGALRAKGSICPNCGFEAKVVSDRIENDGQLFEITKDGMLVAPRKSGGAENWSLAQKIIFMSELKAFALEKGRQMGWIKHAYKRKFGVWPYGSLNDCIPANEVGTYTRSYCKSLDIAWYNSQNYRNRVNSKMGAGKSI
jgi:DNA repair protein RadD